ncbi:MAG: hypothetical protein ACTFAK_02315 [Candidatus Electronema sp. VV]
MNKINLFIKKINSCVGLRKFNLTADAFFYGAEYAVPLFILSWRIVMKKVLLGLAAAAGVFGFGGSAFAAGTGGIAGSAAFQLNAGAVTSASAAVAVGKATAYVGAATDVPAGATEAFAVGTGGAITPSGTNIYITSIAEESAAGLAVAQANSIDITTAVINVNATGGTISVTP